MNNKKGISAVVATVLIILITVAAVTIIWAAIIPMINTQLSRGTVCLDAMSQLTILNKGYTCYNDATEQVEVQISHGSQDFGLSEIQVLISDDIGNTETVPVSVNIPGVNEERVVYADYIGNADSVRIAPVISIGNSLETCDASASVVLQACS